MSGWTLTLPSGWGMAFFSSLIFSQTRIGGLRERSQQSFEAGIPRFPQDYPGTKAFKEYEDRRRSDDESYWNRRPPAKRPSFGKLGTERPFEAGFEDFLKRWEKLADSEDDAAAVVEEEEVKTSLESAPFVLPDRIVKKIEDYLRKSKKLSLKKIPDLPHEGRNMIERALVRVKVEPVGRGAPEELGILYLLERGEKVREEVVESLKKLDGGKKKGTGNDRERLVLADGEVADDWRVRRLLFTLPYRS